MRAHNVVGGGGNRQRDDRLSSLLKLDDTAGPSFQPAFRRVVLAPELLDYPPLPSAKAAMQGTNTFFNSEVRPVAAQESGYTITKNSGGPLLVTGAILYVLQPVHVVTRVTGKKY